LEEEDIMKKLGFIVAAVAAIAIGAPSVASAEKIIIKRGGDHHGSRAEFRGHRDHGWHRGHDRKVVIIKRGHDRRY
jgi:hypothetical protein